jgi:hypothetical protein
MHGLPKRQSLRTKRHLRVKRYGSMLREPVLPRRVHMRYDDEPADVYESEFGMSGGNLQYLCAVQQL